MLYRSPHAHVHLAVGEGKGLCSPSDHDYKTLSILCVPIPMVHPLDPHIWSLRVGSPVTHSARATIALGLWDTPPPVALPRIRCAQQGVRMATPAYLGSSSLLRLECKGLFVPSS